MGCKQPKNMCSNSSSPVLGSKGKPPGLLLHHLCDGFETCNLITGNLHQKRPCTAVNMKSLEVRFRTMGNSTSENCIEDILKATCKFCTHCKAQYCPYLEMKQQCFVHSLHTSGRIGLTEVTISLQHHYHKIYKPTNSKRDSEGIKADKAQSQFIRTPSY